VGGFATVRFRAMATKSGRASLAWSGRKRSSGIGPREPSYCSCDWLVPILGCFSVSLGLSLEAISATALALKSERVPDLLHVLLNSPGREGA